MQKRAECIIVSWFLCNWPDWNASLSLRVARLPMYLSIGSLKLLVHSLKMSCMNFSLLGEGKSSLMCDSKTTKHLSTGGQKPSGDEKIWVPKVYISDARSFTEKYILVIQLLTIFFVKSSDWQYTSMFAMFLKHQTLSPTTIIKKAQKSSE